MFNYLDTDAFQFCFKLQTWLSNFRLDMFQLICQLWGSKRAIIKEQTGNLETIYVLIKLTPAGVLKKGYFLRVSSTVIPLLFSFWPTMA